MLGGLALFFLWNHKSSRTNATSFPLNQAQEGSPSVYKNIYENEKYRFSFKYPEGFTPREFSDELGDVVVVEKSGEEGFQVFVTPFDEPGPVTPERILLDVPEMIIESPQSVNIAGVETLVFFTPEEGLGKTREVWFVREGHLYQVSARSEFDAELSKIMATWKFQ